MKKLGVLLVVAVSVVMFSCNGSQVKFKSAKDYNDYIVQVVHEVDNSWSDVMHEKDLDKSLAKADILIKVSQDGLIKLKNLKTFKKDNLFKKSSIAYIEYINKIAQKELKEFLHLIHDESPNDKRLDELIVILDDERESKFHVLTVCQQLFAATHHLNLAQNS
jgi:CO dehydrogenase/acetyl-CoA synthase beta subunit